MTPRSAAALTRTKQGYVTAARAVGRGARRVGVLPSNPPSREHRLRHWAYSLTSVHDVQGLADLGVPWWTYAAIEEVDSWMSERGERARVFEWGAGASTLWLAERAGSVHSIEHDPTFAAFLRPQLPSTVQLDVVESVPVSRPQVGSDKEGYRGLDFVDYVAAIDGAEGMFDLVVVDGRARAECFTRALPRLRPGGMVVFDNSRRRRYRPAIDAAVRAGRVSERQRFGLTPTLPYPDQTSVMRVRG